MIGGGGQAMATVNIEVGLGTFPRYPQESTALAFYILVCSIVT